MTRITMLIILALFATEAMAMPNTMVYCTLLDKNWTRFEYTFAPDRNGFMTEIRFAKNGVEKINRVMPLWEWSHTSLWYLPDRRFNLQLMNSSKPFGKSTMGNAILMNDAEPIAVGACVTD